MILNELKTWIDNLPEEFGEFTIVNGEEGILDGEHQYRVDKPITTLLVDQENREIVILNPLYDGEDKEEDKG
jgi:hypothetical protein